jgi:hypothetical protein
MRAGSVKGDSVNHSRYQDLLAKRDRVGLSDEEANELGRMFAQIQGRPYSNAHSLRTTARGKRDRAFGRLRRLHRRQREQERDAA